MRAVMDVMMCTKQQTYMDRIVVDAFRSVGYNTSWECHLDVDEHIFFQFDHNRNGVWEAKEVSG